MNAIQSRIPTEIVEIFPHRLGHSRIFAFCLNSGPTGSMKDFMATQVLSHAIQTEQLRSPMRVVEASSGNTGAAVAFASRELGFQTSIFVADTVSPEKIAIIRSFGADVHIIPSSEGPQSEIVRAREYARRQNGYLFNQFENGFQIEGYKSALLPILLEKLSHLGVRLDTFVAGIGSGASCRALGEGLVRQHNPGLNIIGVTPESYPTEIEGLHPDHKVPTGAFPLWRNRPPGLERAMIRISDAAAFQQLLWLNDNGISAGPGSGATLAAAVQLESPGNTLILICDGAVKYHEKITRWRQKRQSAQVPENQ